MKIQSYSASKLHKLGGKLREEDKLEESVIYETLALVKFAKAKDYAEVSDTLQSRFLTWKHLFLLTKDDVYLELAMKDAQASLSITQRLKVKGFHSKCYFRMGEAYMLEGDYKSAVPNYTKALKFYNGSLSEKGDYRYHLGEALYRSGNKKLGKEEMMKGLQEIENGKSGVDSFVFNVWKSGCLMRLAELLRDDSNNEAKVYLRSAGEIINSDKRLVIRKRQFEELKRDF